MELSLIGRKALVCGSSKGIGLATAQAISELGASVILIGRESRSLEDARKTIKGTSHCYQADLSISLARSRLLDSLNQDGHEVDILINNAGGPMSGPFLKCKPEDMYSALQTHLFAMDELSRGLIPGMANRNYGRIVNVVSVTARIPLNNMLLSNTVRGAVLSWSKTVANEVAANGITVNNILPGYTRTERIVELSRSLANQQNCTDAEVQATWVNQVPMRRLGEPEEIANVIAFLCTPAASFVTGTSIPVDGGWTPAV